mgnify:CR=1 FL=1|tara:strand:- start:1465 stop:1848 length:384 start_codon:yes stop_codon:yes gene_type:complete
MIKTIIKDFPITDVASDRDMSEEKIKQILPHLCYTKDEVDVLIQSAVDEARKIDEESMRKHNRDATIISMILGFTCLALFLDGLLRILGIIPPFAGLDVNVIDDIAEKTKVIVENDLSPVLNKIPRL